MLVFLDAGILFSASRADSLMARFIARLADVSALCSNPYAVEEARRNIKLKFPEQEKQLIALLEGIAIVGDRTNLPDIKIREKDRPILEGAVAAQSTHLLTSDRRDFGRFFGKTIRGVKIISPQQLAEDLVDHGFLTRLK